MFSYDFFTIHNGNHMSTIDLNYFTKVSQTLEGYVKGIGSATSFIYLLSIVTECDKTSLPRTSNFTTLKNHNSSEKYTIIFKFSPGVV